VNGNPVTGMLIGGPAFFYQGIYFSAYRAEITNLVSSGANTLTVDEMDFGNNEDNGAGLLVIFDDGSGTADIQVVDGIDLAFVNFPEPRKSTILQTFTLVAIESFDRMADLVIFAGSVGGTNRPNAITVTSNGTAETVVNPLGSFDGDYWDTLKLPVSIPADATELTVQVFSQSDGSANLPASLSWIAAGLSVPPECEGRIGDYVWFDDGDGCQDPGEGIEGVEVCIYENADCAAGTPGPGTPVCTTTDANGFYLFDNLECGKDYEVKFIRPDGYLETVPNAECPDNPGLDSANDSDCVAG
jgi:hypothetical protein